VPDVPVVEEPADKLLWPSGVGGAQCAMCGDTTIVRFFPVGFGDDEDPFCRECIEGDDDDD
jgi:hypothetical protein